MCVCVCDSECDSLCECDRDDDFHAGSSRVTVHLEPPSEQLDEPLRCASVQVRSGTWREVRSGTWRELC